MSSKNKETLKFSAEISKVLQLMIHSLYTNKDIFLRELISNSSDACDKLRYETLTNAELSQGESELKIGLSVNKDTRTLIITDNGIGMSRDEMVNNLGTIAKSGTQEFMTQLEGADGKSETAASLIGQFGVGFYSCFMVADRVSVISTRAGSNESWQWESEGNGEFSITQADAAPRGTSITLHLKEGDDQYLDTFRLRHIAQTYSDHISFPISLSDEKEGTTETVNTGSALWTRNKSEITPEQYTEFYHHVAHSPDEPWLVLHNKAEGKLEYTNLLFVPSMKPFDLFHPERKRRVKLFVRRVFITEENVEVVPAYMRFLRGIVDSQDLPLNISRETLQHNPLIAKIRDSLVARVLSELKKKATDAENYMKFWSHFGPVLKEGLCESISPKEQILEVCRFYSTNAEDSATTSLDEYVSRMKEGQEDIFYLTGERLETLRGSPQLEGFAKRGVEVLLLCDHVDDFWVNVVQNYKGKNLHSVTRADINLDNMTGEPKTEEEKEQTPATEKVAALCERFRNILGKNIKDVRATDKLTSSAVCLAVEEGAMDFRLERFLIEQKQLTGASAKILEINPDHSIIKSLLARLDDTDSSDMEDTVFLLFDQARILEGEAIGDLAAFTRRVQKLMEKNLAA